MFLDRWRRSERPSPPPGEDAERDPRALAVRLTLVVLAVGVFVMLPPQSGLLLTATTDVFVRLGLFATFVVAATLRQTGSRVPVVLGTLATAGWLVLELMRAVPHPMRGLFTLLAAIGVFTFFWPYRLDGDAPKRPLVVPAALSLAAGLHAVVLHGIGGPVSAFAQTAMYLVVPWVALRTPEAGRTLPRLAIAAGLMPLADGVLQLLSIESELTPIGLASPILALLHPHAGGGGVGWGGRGDTIADILFARPSRVLVVSFLLLCIGGTALLRLPVSAVQELSWLDAAFTATSAVCVTGLIVVDTPNALSGFGQFALLLLIQLGGLGIMSLSAATVAVLGRRLPVSYERATADIIGAQGLAGIAPAIRLIFKATVLVEGVGAVLLFVAFLVRGEGVASAAWRAVFTSISAFCNAGFALQSDSLVPYAEDPFVLAVIGAVIVAGGLGPVVLLALWPGVPQRRTLQVRLALWATAVLLVVPALLIALIEWNHTLADLGTADRLMNAAFQSITLRTAGFNSIDLTQIQPATWTLMIVAMFIGGCPGSTAGGVKTTTFALFVLLVASVVRREPHVQVLGRRVSRSSVQRAAATIAVASVGALFALLTMQLTQPMALDVVFFEVISALATVGLSTGGTGELDEVGKTVIILCMFTGRVGPLTLFSFFSRTVEPRRERVLPEEPVATA